MKKLLALLGLGVAGGVSISAAIALALPILLGQAGGLFDSLEALAVCQSQDESLRERCDVLRGSIRAKQEIIDDLLAGRCGLDETMGRFRRALEIADDDGHSLGDEQVFGKIVDWVSSTLVDDPPRLESTLSHLRQQRARRAASPERVI